jgi:hypothetical protein
MTSLKPGTALLAALRLAEFGLASFPLQPAQKRPYQGKGEHGVKGATTDPEALRTAFARRPTANVGIAGGAVSGGLFILDVDPREKGDEKLSRLEKTHSELPRTWEQRTGRGDGGRHLFFRLPEGFKLQGKLGGEVGLDLKGEGGYVVAAPSIHPDSGQPYEWIVSPADCSVADAPAWLLDLARKPQPKTSPARETAPAPSSRVSRRFQAWMATREPAIDGVGDSKTFLTARCVWGWIKNHGLPEAEGWAAWSAWNATCLPPWKEPDLLRKWEQGRDADTHPEFPDRHGSRAQESAAMPIVHVTTALHLAIDEAITALATDANVYQREGQLVDVVRASATAPDRLMANGAPRIRAVSPHALRDRLTRVANVVKHDGRSKDGDKWVPTMPTDALVHGILSRGEYPLRPLIGVVEAPSFRRDGSILQEPGYDERTGYLYVPSSPFPLVPAEPTQGDAVRAMRELEEVWADFPFELPAHRYAVLAALLTVLARPAIEGAVPCFLFDANVRGGGKTLASDTVGLLATGRVSAKTGWPGDAAELDKVLGAYALRGASLINFDNIDTAFGGGPLDRCVTAADTVESRVLGRSSVPTLPWRAVVMGSGNNVQVIGDTSRRVLVVRIESPLERPEERGDFRHPDLLAWCKAERPRLVVAALTVLRAFHVGDQPRGECKAWGSFEAWSALVPPAIVYAGGVDPMGARLAVSGRAEPEAAALMSLLDGLDRLEKDGWPGGMSIRDLVTLLYPEGGWRGERAPDGYDDLREAIEALAPPQPGKSPTSAAVGNALRRFRGRIIGGRKLESVPGRAGVARWRVERGGWTGGTGGTSPAHYRQTISYDLDARDSGIVEARATEEVQPVQPVQPEPSEGNVAWNID